MRGGSLPPALLFAALGLALAFAPRRTWRPALIGLVATLVVFRFVPISPQAIERIFLGCWVSVIVTAAAVHFMASLGRPAAIALSINAAVWASLVVSVSGSPLDLLKALACILLVWPAAWLVGRGAGIAVAVASSWLIAIALLAAALPFLPVTPGYLPDHME